MILYVGSLIVANVVIIFAAAPRLAPDLTDLDCDGTPDGCDGDVDTTDSDCDGTSDACSGQHGDDGDDDQKLEEREASA